MYINIAICDDEQQQTAYIKMPTKNFRFFLWALLFSFILYGIINQYRIKNIIRVFLFTEWKQYNLY